MAVIKSPDVFMKPTKKGFAKFLAKIAQEPTGLTSAHSGELESRCLCITEQQPTAVQNELRLYNHMSHNSKHRMYICKLNNKSKIHLTK